MKKITVFLLVIAMLVSFAMPAFAEESYAQNLYKAYCDLKDACESGDLAELKEAYGNLEEAFNIGDEDLTAEEQTEFGELMGTANYDDAFEKIWELDDTVSAVLDMEEVYNDFADDPNEITAENYVYIYEMLLVYGESEETKTLVKKFYDDAEKLYEDALEMIPAHDIDALVEAHRELEDVLKGSSYQKLSEVWEKNFDAFMIMDSLTAAELDEFAAAIGAEDADEANDKYYEVQSCAYSLIYFADACELFAEDPNEENARSLVGEYESMTNPEYTDEPMTDMLLRFFPDAEEVYQQALKAIPAIDVDAVYAAYEELLAAWEKGTLKALLEVQDAYDLLSEKAYLMNEEEFAEFCSLLGAADEFDAYEKLADAQGYMDDILSVDEVIRAYEEERNTENVMDVIYTYESIFEIPEMMDEDLQDTIRKYFPEFEDIYRKALEEMPEADPQVVYDIYKKLSEALEKKDPELLKKAIEEFGVLSEVIFMLEDEHIEKLTELMGAKDSDEALGLLWGAVFDASVLMNAVSLSEAYIAEPNKETAKEFIMFYDSLFIDPEFESEELRAFVREFCPNIDDVYAAAKELVPVADGEEEGPDDEFTSDMDEEDPPIKEESPSENEEQEQIGSEADKQDAISKPEMGTENKEPEKPEADSENQPEEEKTDPNIPQTGDDSNLLLCALAALMGAAGVLLLGKKFKEK